jgi:hypothetical protein
MGSLDTFLADTVGRVSIGFDDDNVTDVVWVILIENARSAGADYDIQLRL